MKLSLPALHARSARRAVQAFAGLTAAALLVAGCGSSSSGNSGGGDSNSGGNLTFLLDSLGNTWVPNSASFSSYQGNIWDNIADKLVYVSADGKASPWIATSWSNNKTYTQFTLHLKSGVTFSDGEALDAAAVVANLDYWAHGQPEKGIAPIGLFPKTYKNSIAVNSSTVQVNFSAPTLGFIPTLGYAGSALFSPKTLQGSATQQADLANDFASGPYVLKSWKADDNVVLQKRADYNWGPAATGSTGPATISTITYKVSADPAVRTAAVQAGQAQVAYNPTPQQITKLESAGFKVYTPTYIGFSFGYALNAQYPLFKDAKVRQAVQHGIDRQQILSTVYTPDWKAATTFFNSNVPGAIDGSKDFAYDPTESAKLLAEDGWTKGSDGFLTKGGQEATLTLFANPYLPSTKQVDQLVATQLGKLGIKVTVQTYDVITYGTKVVQGSPTVGAYEVTRSIGDAGTAGAVFSSANKGENWFGLGTSDSTIEKLRVQIASAIAPAKRDTELATLQNYVLNQGYYIPITQIVQRPIVTTSKLTGINEDSTAFPTFRTATLS